MEKQIKKQIKVTDRLTSYLVKIGVVMVGVMLAMQLGVLATLGTKGAEVTNIRAEKKFYREEIDRIKADIDSAKTLAQIESGIGVVYRQEGVAARPIEINLRTDADTVGLLSDNGN